MAIRLCYDYQIFAGQKFGGVSRYFVELAKRVHALKDVDLRIVAPIYRNSLLAAERNHLPVLGVYFPADFPGASVVCGRLCNVLSRSIAGIYHPDIVHETYHSHNNTLGGAPRKVITVYDTIREIFGGSSPAIRALTRLRQAAFNRADHLICISENTRADLLRLYKVDPQKTSVILLASSLSAPKDTLPSSADPFFLHVGNRGGYKNFLALVAAFGESRLYVSHQLVCFGGGKLTQSEIETIGRCGIPERRVVLVDGEDELLARHYATAVALVYPSLYEGFGIPVLEAMECGCPVLCSGSSSLPEVGGNAALYFDATDSSAIAAAMLLIAQSTTERSVFIDKGREQVRRFSWEICAQHTLAIYKRLMSSQ